MVCNHNELLQDTDLMTILYDVDSTDDDIGKNGQIRYSIESVRIICYSTVIMCNNNCTFI